MVVNYELVCMLPFLYTPAVCGDTLVTTVFLVPVFALHSRIGAAGSYTNVRARSGSHARDSSDIHLHLHLRDNRRHADVNVKKPLSERLLQSYREEMQQFWKQNFLLFKLYISHWGQCSSELLSLPLPLPLLLHPSLHVAVPPGLSGWRRRTQTWAFHRLTSQ